MGSFSWLKADKLTKVRNIACGRGFKFLIPKEFGGGFIKDFYQDYGYLGINLNEEPLLTITDKNIKYKFILAKRNNDIEELTMLLKEYNINIDIDSAITQLYRYEFHVPKYDMYELVALWNKPEKLKFDGEIPKLKEIDEHTDYNREIGINIACCDNDMDSLKFPLKLVSPSYKGSYEDLDSCSYGDTDQGFYEVKR